MVFVVTHKAAGISTNLLAEMGKDEPVAMDI